MTDGHFDNKTRVGWALAVTASFMVVEAAGGSASDGKNRILGIQPTELHQRTPVFMGSPIDVEDALRFAVVVVEEGELEGRLREPFNTATGVQHQFCLQLLFERL